jgi:hypothetical protein
MAAKVPGSFTRQAPVHKLEERRGKKEEAEEVEEVEAAAPDAMGMGLGLVATPTLQEWDPTSLPDNFFLVLEGKRRTGKSTFAKWLLQYYVPRFSVAWCMTNTKASGYWQEFVGEAFTFDSWYPSAVYKLISRGQKFVEMYGEESEAAKKFGSSLLILDDVISDRIHDDPIFLRLAVEGRHHLVSIILMTQDPKAINPKVRDNTDCAVIFNQKTFRNKESIWHDFMNDTPKDVALSLLSRYAVEHNALVTVQTNLNSKLQKNFFKSTGDKTKLKDPEYILGGPQQREIVAKERVATKIRKQKQAEASKFAKEDANEVKKYTSQEILK